MAFVLFFIVFIVLVPSVIVEYNVTGHLVDRELAEGQFLDIMCIASISQYIDTGVSVTVSWMRDNTTDQWKGLYYQSSSYD